MKKRILAALTVLLVPAQAFAQTTWTPILTETSFSGIKTDLLTGANGLVLLTLIIVGVSMLFKIFR
jgi:hypothetical protein